MHRCITESQFAALANKEYVFGFDEEMLEMKRAIDDQVRSIDLQGTAPSTPRSSRSLSIVDRYGTLTCASMAP